MSFRTVRIYFHYNLELLLGARVILQFQINSAEGNMRVGKRWFQPDGFLKVFYRSFVLVLFLRDQSQIVEGLRRACLLLNTLLKPNVSVGVLLLLEQHVTKMQLCLRIVRLTL